MKIARIAKSIHYLTVQASSKTACTPATPTPTMTIIKTRMTYGLEGNVLTKLF